MKTSLQYINDEAEKFVDVAKKPIFKTIAGFKVQVSDEAEKSVTGYKHDRDTVRTMLSEAGITPLAILPKTWWSNIVEETDLTDLHLSTQQFSISDARGLRNLWLKQVNNRSRKLGVIAGLVAGLVAGVTSPFIPGFEGNVVDLLLTGVISMAATAALGSLTTAIVASVLRGRPSSLSAVLAQPGVINAHVKPIPADEGRYHELRMSFELPTPPADVAETIKSLLNSKLKDRARVAAEPTAFKFSPSIESKILDVDREIRDQEAALRADPIIYVEIGSAVAIIAQFGDFPVEKQVVDAALKMSL